MRVKEKQAVQVIKSLLTRLEGLDFALIGTFNLFAHGAEIVPADIDFLTDDENIKEIAKRLSSVIRDIHGYKETEITIEGLEVHFVSRSTNLLRDESLSDKEFIKMSEIKVPCMPLESELKFYKKLDTDKAKIKVKIISNLISS